VADPSSPMHARAAQALFGFVQFAAKLKSVPRTGWLDRGLDSLRVESVADHSFGVALLAWICALQRQAEGAEIDPERVLKLALIHDLAEAETGDSTPYDSAAIPSERHPAARRAFLQTRHSRDPGRHAAKRSESFGRSFNWRKARRPGSSSRSTAWKRFCSPGSTWRPIPLFPSRRSKRRPWRRSMIRCSPPSVMWRFLQCH
jgi:hypothetical protein